MKSLHILILAMIAASAVAVPTPPIQPEIIPANSTSKTGDSPGSSRILASGADVPGADIYAALHTNGIGPDNVAQILTYLSTNGGRVIYNGGGLNGGTQIHAAWTKLADGGDKGASAGSTRGQLFLAFAGLLRVGSKANGASQLMDSLEKVVGGAGGGAQLMAALTKLASPPGPK